MNIHLSILALEVAGASIAAIFIGTVFGMMAMGDDCFIPIPFTRDKIHGGHKYWSVPELPLTIGTLLFPVGLVGLIISIGMQIAVWIHAA